MCGITGIYAFNEVGKFFKINLVQATDAISSRGPDQQGQILHEDIGLGHRRLSIIDTSLDGKQPMEDPSGRYTIVFNGEIYNFMELRQELEQKGIAFKSKTDTEVLLQLLIHEGKACLNKLNGFFAFAFLDKHTNTLLLARDRMGIKPLHIYQDEDKLLFASELKAIMAYGITKEVDYASLLIYLQLNYIPPPYSILKNVKKLMPGYWMEISNKEITEGQYYKIPYIPHVAENNAKSYDELKTELVDLLEESVRKRLVADVPLGTFLSGGIDSSIITALASRHTEQLNTFSIGFKDNPFFDETQYAELVARKYNTNHTVFKLSNDDLFSHYQGILDYTDEPFADSSAIPVNILSHETRKHVTVALSGDGADELFGGYNKYMAEWKARHGGFAASMVGALAPLWNILPQSRNSSLGNKIRQLARFAEGKRMKPKDRYWRWASFTSKDEVMELLKEQDRDVLYESDSRQRLLCTDLGNAKTLNDVLYNDMHMVLAGDMLPKVDLMSMKNSLEVRVPFLDHEVVDFAFTLPSRHKVDGKMKKKIVRNVFRDILPEELYKRPKQGFDVPMREWFETDLRKEIKSLFNDDFIREQGIFRPEKISALKDTILKGGSYDQESVWNLIVLQYWWKNTLDLE